MKDKVIPILVVVLGIVFACVIGSAMLSEQSKAQAEQAALPQPADDTGLILFFCVIGVVAAFIFIDSIIQKIKSSGNGGIALTVFIGAVVLIVGGYLFFVADKNGDGVNDVQVVKMVQPTGNNAAEDLTYSSANKANGEANVVNAVAFLIIGCVIALVMFASGMMSLFLRSDQ